MGFTDKDKRPKKYRPLPIAFSLWYNNYPIYILLSITLFFLTIGFKVIPYNHWSMTTKTRLSFFIDDVVSLDYSVYKNVKATLKGAYSQIHWDVHSIGTIGLQDNLQKFQVVPLMATVDRRPLTARMQMMTDSHNLSYHGHRLGCAFTSSTFVSNLRDISTMPFKRRHRVPAKCSVCFQFSSHEDMNTFLEEGQGYQPIRVNQTSLGTKCFPGTAEVTARFARWQKQDPRFLGHGYPFTVDCRLVNGIEELTCDGITRILDNPKYQDTIQKIYYSTEFQLSGYFTHDVIKPFVVESIWPWEAVQSHNDDRRHIVQSLPSSWDDTTSKYIPSHPQEMKLLHIEGPSYSLGYSDTSSSSSNILQSMIQDPQSPGGIHPRLLVNLIHFLRLAPNSTHMIAVVDGQTQRTMEYLTDLLHMTVHQLYPYFSHAIVNNVADHQSTMNHIPLENMLFWRKKSFARMKTTSSTVTLGALLQKRGIKIHIVPLVTPSIAFEKSVCGIQYQLTSYITARYAADYQVMIYADGDTSFIEHTSKTLQEILYDRLFSPTSYRCVGHRFRLLEQYIHPSLDTVDLVLNCTYQVSTNKMKWLEAVRDCQLKEGHIVARTDSIYELNVHHPDTLADYVVPGVRDCISPGDQDPEDYFFNADELVQVHLRNRLRKEECSCTL